MPINLIPFSQLKEIMEQNMYHMSTVKPKKRCAKKTTNIKASIDRYNKKYTLFSKINNTKLAVTFSDAAKTHVLSYLRKQASCKGIRLSVKKTGCSGLSYVVDYVDEPMADDIVMPLIDNYLVCIDKKSYPYLKGMDVDYVKQGFNAKFVFNNPNQTGQCGCGESFTV